MPTPVPSPTVYVVMEGQSGFWNNPPLITLLAVLIGGLITFFTQVFVARHQRKTDLAKEFSEVRRGLYVRVSQTFDRVNHLLLELIRRNELPVGAEPPDNDDAKIQIGNMLVDLVNNMTGLATELGITGARDIADLLHQSVSTRSLPAGRQGNNQHIDEFTVEQLKEYRELLERRRFEADRLMRDDLDVLSGEMRRRRVPLP